MNSKITSPLNHSKLKGKNLTLKWCPNKKTESWYILVINMHNYEIIFNGFVTNTLELKFSNMPTNGEEIGVYFMPLKAHDFAKLQHYIYTADTQSKRDRI